MIHETPLDYGETVSFSKEGPSMSPSLQLNPNIYLCFPGTLTQGQWKNLLMGSRRVDRI